MLVGDCICEIKRSSLGGIKRHGPLREGRGEWTFGTRTYQTECNSIAPPDIPANPVPKGAYRAVASLGGFIRRQMSTAGRSDGALKEFNPFRSTIGSKAVTTVLSGITNGSSSKSE